MPIVHRCVYVYIRITPGSGRERPVAYINYIDVYMYTRAGAGLQIVTALIQKTFRSRQGPCISVGLFGFRPFHWALGRLSYSTGPGPGGAEMAGT